MSDSTLLARVVTPGILSVARVAHEANRAWCVANGDDSQPTWDDAPDWQKDSAVDGVFFHFENHTAGPDASHNNWTKQKVEDGWTYGPEKDPEAKTHPCLVPFEELPPEQQAKDRLFKSICEALSF